MKKRALIAGAAAMVAALGLAACSSPSGNSGGSSNATLRLAIQAPPASFAIGDLDSGQDNWIYGGVYESIITQDVSGKPIPGIAESWKYSDDNKTLTLKIRTGQKFSDGEKLDAQAVVDSLKVAQKGPQTSARFTAVTSIDATDDSTVVLKLSHPDAALIPALGGAAAGFVAAPKTLNSDKAATQPVGSGPYVLDQSKTTAGAIYTLTRNEKYRDVKDFPFKTVTVKIITDRTAVANAVRAGQLDFAYTDPATFKSFPTGKFRSGTASSLGMGALWLADRDGTVVPALKDVRVRQAINLALDRKQIVKTIGQGLGVATDQVYIPSGKAYDSKLNDMYKYDPAAAKKLMAEAGYASGFSITMPSTVYSQQYESTISQELGDIGIKVTWETVPTAQSFGKILAKAYGMFYMPNGFSGDAIDTQVVLSGIFNPFQSTSPELQQRLDAVNDSSGATQQQAYRDLNEFFVKQAWFAPLFTNDSLYVTPKSVIYTPPTGTALVLLKNFKPAN